jgi:DNA helicase-2/ATP-dependent DNA helicase PcrA
LRLRADAAAPDSAIQSGATRMTSAFVPRPSQRAILRYREGKLGISAVPGSGKTHTLSALAAQIIADNRVGRDQEVLIVTLVNSAVDNFESRITGFVQEHGLIPHLGYRVRTLHGLAHDIVRENPPLVGLDKQFAIVDEIASAAIVRDAAHAWARLHPEVREAYFADGLTEKQQRRVAEKDWPELVEGLAGSFIKAAKNHRRTPDLLAGDRAASPETLPLADMGIEIYSSYQLALGYRGAVDFDDLIRLAFLMLQQSPDLLERLRHRWPFILEDEAQDSSELQQDILALLAGEDGNWVRVGDPNQAIFETFTTADPELLRRFIRLNPRVDMPESGRCQPRVMGLANQLIGWTMKAHPRLEVRDALAPPLIHPAPGNDPQPNPQDNPAGIVFLGSDLTPQQEIHEVMESLGHWLPRNGQRTVAILCGTNDHAANVVQALQRRKLAYRELLRSTSPTRTAVGAISHVLGFLAAPEVAVKLAQAYRVWRRNWRGVPEYQALYAKTADALASYKHVEEFIAPGSASGSDLAESKLVPVLGILSDSEEEAVRLELSAFRDVVSRWLEGTTLPIDQLVLTVSQEIFVEPADLALAHKTALLLRQIADENPGWRLPALLPQLREIARNERRFIGFSSDDAGFNPDAHKGEVVVATIHKAKGLEWDRVYLLSVNNYDFPAVEEGDRFIGEKWFCRDGLNLEAEALAQLRAVSANHESDVYVESAATQRSRIDYARERLRLLYVGITRARRELILSSNTGRRGDARPATAFTALRRWYEGTENGPADASTSGV